jgi:4-hydroxybenzoate polyprenyltransferase
MARSTSSPVAASGTATGAVPGRRLALHLLFSLRPGQWTKNLVIFAGLLFGRRLFDADAVLAAVAAFVRVALVSAVALGAIALLAAYRLGWPFTIVAAAYLALQIAYSGPLKHIVIIDVLTIAIGFVLRAVAGAVAVNVEISHWLLVCTILLALFIALAKRRHEIVLLAAGASGHRPILGEYSAYLLDQMIGVVTASTLIAYVFYTISPETVQKFGTQWLGLTIPFPLYGIFRYLYLVHQREGGGSPADLLLTDRPLLACVALWALAVALIIYRPT